MTDIVLRIQTVLGSAVTEVAKFRQEIASTEIATGDLRETWKATTAEIIVDAQKQIASEKEKVDQIRAEIKAVLDLSTTYTKGSDERQIATKMEIDLQRRLQAALGETAVVASKSGRAGSAAAERDLGGFGRGAASRSGVAGVGLSALAGTGFIAGAVVGGVLDASVKAAKQEQIAQANLANALKDTGQARQVSRKALDEYLAAEEHATGFQRDEVMQTLSQLIRSTGSLAKARKEEALMADVARARNTDLSGAMMLVMRAAQGNTGSLKRLGIDVQKVTTYEDQLRAAHITGNVALEKRAKALDLAATKTLVMREVTKKFSGDSAAYMKTFGGETAQLSNEWHDLEVEIGQKAIPVLTELFGWLIKEIHVLEQSKSAHDDLHQAVDALRWGFNAIKTVVETVNKVTGGFGNTLKLLLTYFAVSKVVSFANAIDRQLVAAFGNAEAGAAGAATQSEKVLTNMRNLARMGAISIGVDLLFKTKGKGAEGILGAMLTGAGVGSIFGPEGALVGAALGITIDAIVNLIPSDKAYKYTGAQEARRAMQQTQNQSRVHVGMSLSDLEDIANSIPLYAQNAFAKLMKQLQKEGPGAVVSKQQAAAFNKKYAPSAGIVGQARSLGDLTRGLVYGEGLQQAGLPPAPNRSQILDCSSYVFEVFNAAGFKDFPDVSTTQWTTMRGPNWTSKIISVGDAAPGDVVFYNVPGGEGPFPNHVGIIVSGHGNSSMVMQFTQPGQTAKIYGIIQSYAIQGVKRFYLIKKQAGGGRTTPSGSSGGAAGSTSFAGAVSDAIAQAQAAKGLKEPQLIAIRAAIDAELRALPKYLDPAEKEAIRHIRELERSLHIGMSTTQLARDKAELAKWGKNLKDEIAKQAKEIQDAWNGDLARISKQVNANWAARKAAFDATTKTHLKSLEVAQTPEEKALSDFQAQITAQQNADTMAQLQSDLAAAIATGDPARIKAAYDAINAILQQTQLDALQKAADASRVAQDAKTAKAQAAYTKERDAQWKHLQAIHDDQVRMFDLDLKLWESALEKKAKTWQQFLRWLAHHPISGAFDGSSLQNPLTYHTHDPKDLRKNAAGGVHLRPTVEMLGEAGPEATIPLSGQLGQRAIAQLANAIVAASAGMEGGGGITVYGTFLGATEKQVGRALEGLVTPAQRRVVRYPAPL